MALLKAYNKHGLKGLREGLEAGLSPAESRGGDYPLHAASRRGDAEAVRALLQAGADPNLCNPNGWTALHCACKNKREPVARLLLDAGADPLAATNDGRQALELAICHAPQSDKLLDLLLPLCPPDRGTIQRLLAAKRPAAVQLLLQLRPECINDFPPADFVRHLHSSLTDTNAAEAFALLKAYVDHSGKNPDCMAALFRELCSTTTKTDTKHINTQFSADGIALLIEYEVHPPADILDFMLTGNQNVWIPAIQQFVSKCIKYKEFNRGSPRHFLNFISVENGFNKNHFFNVVFKYASERYPKRKQKYNNVIHELKEIFTSLTDD